MALVFVGAASAGICPNEALRAPLDSASLPNCRAYELISPSAKYGWPVSVTRVSSDGELVTLLSLGGFAGSNQSTIFNTYESDRETTDWGTFPVDTPSPYVVPGLVNLLATTPDLTRGLFEYSLAGAELRNTGFYVSVLPAGTPELVGPRISPATLEAARPGEVLNSSEPSASQDLSRILFMIRGPQFVGSTLVDYLWPGDSTALSPRGNGAGFDSLYEYRGTGNREPMLVGADGDNHLISQCGTSLGFPAGGVSHTLRADEVYNAISAPEGRRIFFTVAPGPCGENNVGLGPAASELYAREEVSAGVVRFVDISEPTAGPTGDCALCDTANPQGGIFQGASEDGSKVFFLSRQHLLAGAEGKSLYMYDFDAVPGARVSLVAPDVEGVARVSEDGSHAYFVATSVLTSAGGPSGISATPGASNLYVYETGTGATSFIGTLLAGDAEDWSQRDERPVDATPDGRFLVFTSMAHLTPGDASSAPQVFEYAAAAKTLTLISSAPGAFAGGAGAIPATIIHSNYAGNVDPGTQLSSVSDNGSDVVFQSEAALTGRAIEGFNNVYLSHEGQLSLISDGQDRSIGLDGIPSVSLVGIDGSGRDIMFTTADQLVPQDGDTQVDVYDARENGGLLPATPPMCEGEGCQGQQTPSLFSTPPGSTGQPAGEQVVEPPAKPSPKAKVKRHAKVKHGRKARKARHRKARKALHANGAPVRARAPR